MRTFIAGLGTETNMFVPFPTGRRAYELWGVYRGDVTKHPPSSFSGPLHVWRRDAETRGWEVVESLCTFAAPAGTTVKSVYEGFRDEMEYRRGFKENIWDVRLAPPKQITPRRRRPPASAGSSPARRR